MSGNGDGPPRTLADVYYAERGLEGGDSGQSAMPKDIYNAPYARKGAILRALGWETGVWGKRGRETPYCIFARGSALGQFVQATLCGSGLPLVHDIEMIQTQDRVGKMEGHADEKSLQVFSARERWGGRPAAVPALVPSNFAQRSEPGSKQVPMSIRRPTGTTRTTTPIFEGLLTLESYFGGTQNICRCCVEK